MARAVCEQAHLVRLPPHKRRELKRLWHGVARIRAALEREPSIEEIGRALALAEDRVRDLFALPRRPVSLDRPLGGEEGGRPLSQLLRDERAPTPAEAALRDLAAERLARVLASLPEREQLILRLRFGFEDGEPRTFRQIGGRLGLTSARARQLVLHALDRLRHPSRRTLLDGLAPGP